MGQQQLLLIVVGVIIVAVAVIAAVSMGSSALEKGTQDSIITRSQHIANLALQDFYKKPALGGIDTFVGYAIPTGLANISGGTIQVAATSNATQLVLGCNMGTYDVITTLNVAANPPTLASSISPIP